MQIRASRPYGVLLAIVLIACSAPHTSAQQAEIAVPPSDAAQTEQPESAVSGSCDVTVASKYLFQGIDYSEGKAVVQPNATLAIRDFSLNAWGNYQADLGEFNEIDLALKYGRSFGSLSITGGYMNLQYPNREGWDPSQEMFLDLAHEGGVTTSLSVHYDFDAGTGAYVTAGIARSLPGSVTLGTNLYYQSGYYDATGIPATEVKATWSKSIGAATITPSVSYFGTWENGDFKDEAAIRSTWLFGLNIASGF